MLEVGCIVRVIDKEAFYYKAIGRIESIDPTQEYAYFVVFEMIDEITGEIEVYEDCYYREDQITIFKY